MDIDNLKVKVITTYIDDTTPDDRDVQKTVVTFMEDNTLVKEINLTELYLDKIAEKGDEFGNSPEDYSISIDADDYTLVFIMQDISYQIHEDGYTSVYHLYGQLLIK